MDSQISLRPADIPIALRLAAVPNEGYESLSRLFESSTSVSHRSVDRLGRAGLLIPGARRSNRAALQEFLTHGLRYAFPAVRLAQTRGFPTAWSAPSLEGKLPSGPTIVWPNERGKVRGEGLCPLSEGAVAAARRDPWMYEMLALVDALRLGQARDRKIASNLIAEQLAHLP